MVSWASKSTKVLLRVVLTLLLVVVGLEVSIRLGGPRSPVPSPRSPVSPVRAVQPDWGGGRLSFRARSVAGIVDSVRTASEENPQTQTYSGEAGGVVLRQKSGADYALTLALPLPGQPGLFELPSSGHFKKELLPGAEDAEAPAADIPLYPRSSCRTQVGRGTACFVGFYLTPDSVEAVRSFYVQALSRLGWERIAADPPGFLETFAKPGEDRTVVVQLRKQDSVTTRIGLVAMSPGSPQ